MSPRGGRRPGSGRKPKPKRIPLTVQLQAALYAALEQEKDRLGVSWPVLLKRLAKHAGITLEEPNEHS